jgi:hypothetical protein
MQGDRGTNQHTGFRIDSFANRAAASDDGLAALRSMYPFVYSCRKSYESSLSLLSHRRRYNPGDL